MSVSDPVNRPRCLGRESKAMNHPFIKITSDYGWIGRFAWHNSADWAHPHPVFNPFRVWGMIAWMQSWGPRGHVDA
jgi:hypothetical protein